MDFSQTVKDRFSCKKYNSEKKVPKETVLSIINDGRLAPTAKNLQEQHIYVIEGEKLSLIDEVTPCRYGAQTVVLVAFDKNKVFTYPGGKYDSGVEDAAIVATHLMLSATAHGVDNCWINNFDPDKLHELLNLPENEKILMLLDLGYRAEGAEALPNHFSRKDLSETVTFL